MMKSPVVRIIADVAVFLSAVAAIHLGLVAFGYDLTAMSMLSGVKTYLNYVFGVAGVITLVFLLMNLNCHCHCED